VQAGSAAKSIGGIENTFVNDGSVVLPDLNSRKCVAIGLGINPFYSDIDPYWMAALAIEEALRNVACLGGSLKHTYILDNFSWGSPLDEKVLGGLVRACRGCYDFSTYFRVPFISGKDSLYNEYTVGDKRIVIPGTLLISAMAIIDDCRKIVSSPFKKEGNLIYILGHTRPELGGSEYLRGKKITGGFVPHVDKKTSLKIFEALERVMDKDLVKSCHDLSEGGLAVALAEMCIGSNFGANVFLQDVPHEKSMLNCEILFSESASRFLVEVEKSRKDEFECLLNGIPHGLIGCVAANREMFVYGINNKEVVNITVDGLNEAWTGTFKGFRYNP
jgi:phosphoribosylformylglycinamidine synthase